MPARCPILSSLYLLMAGWIVFSPGMPASAADPVVRQGSNDDLEFKVLHSPVTVEASLDEFIALPRGQRWALPPIGHFYCDGVTIETIHLKKVRAPGLVTGEHNAIHVSVELRTRAQKDDMAVDMEFVLLDGDRRLLLGRIVNTEIEAGKTESAGQAFELSATDREAWFGPGKHATLRITISTRPN